MLKIYRIRDYIRDFIRRIVVKPGELSLNKYKFSLISRDCLGGKLLHEYNQRFNSPFVNLYLTNQDFIVLCNHLHGFLSAKLYKNESETEIKGFPVGNLTHDGLTVSILHDNSFEKSLCDWERRITRICWNNIFVISTNLDKDLTNDMLKEFDKIKYPHLMLVEEKFESSSCVFVKPNKRRHYWNYVNCISLRKTYDRLHFTHWIKKNYNNVK